MNIYLTVTKSLCNYPKLLLFLFLIAGAAPAFDEIASANLSDQSPPTVRSVPRPKIVSRKDWSAREAVLEMKPHKIAHITIHHTATLQKKDVSIEKKMQSLQAFSQREDKLASGKIKPVWADVPYHFYISVDGNIAEGRDINFAGDTNTDYNPTGHALVVLEGNFETEQPSEKQIKALQELAGWLADEWKVPAAEIKTHKDYASTACPGKNLYNLMKGLRQKIEETKTSTD